jgi:hypothetical protein
MPDKRLAQRKLVRMCSTPREKHWPNWTKSVMIEIANSLQVLE